jgi:hypothetical protein
MPDDEEQQDQEDTESDDSGDTAADEEVPEDAEAPDPNAARQATDKLYSLLKPVQDISRIEPTVGAEEPPPDSEPSLDLNDAPVNPTEEDMEYLVGTEDPLLDIGKDQSNVINMSKKDEDFLMGGAAQVIGTANDKQATYDDMTKLSKKDEDFLMGGVDEVLELPATKKTKYVTTKKKGRGRKKPAEDDIMNLGTAGGV